MNINGYALFLINTLDTIVRRGNLQSGIRAELLMLHGRLEAESTKIRLGRLQVGELQHWHLLALSIALDLVVQFKL